MMKAGGGAFFNQDRFFKRCDAKEFTTNAVMLFVITVPRVKFGGEPCNKTTMIGVERSLMHQIPFFSMFCGFSYYAFSRKLQYTPIASALMSLTATFYYFTVYNIFSKDRAPWEYIHVRTFDRK